MSLPIGPETTVGAMLEAYPELEGVLLEMAPAFAKLRNPVVRRTVAKVANLEQAAKIGGISLQAMILRLRNVTGQTAPDLPVLQPRKSTRTPCWNVEFIRSGGIARLWEYLVRGKWWCCAVHSAPNR